MWFKIWFILKLNQNLVLVLFGLKWNFVFRWSLGSKLKLQTLSNPKNKVTDCEPVLMLFA